MTEVQRESLDVAVAYERNRGHAQSLRSRVVAEAFPEAIHRFQVSARERFDCRKLGHPFGPVWNDSGDSRLLQHDLGDPDLFGDRFDEHLAGVASEGSRSFYLVASPVLLLPRQSFWINVLAPWHPPLLLDGVEPGQQLLLKDHGVDRGVECRWQLRGRGRGF